MEPEHILSQIRAYCSRHGMKPSTFGAKAANDGKLVRRLEAGRTVTLTTFASIQRQLSLPPSQSAHAERAA